MHVLCCKAEFLTSEPTAYCLSLINEFSSVNEEKQKEKKKFVYFVKIKNFKLLVMSPNK